MTYTIAICHQKGGVAKTTTAIALGACFAERGLNTLLIDLDPQASMTSGLGISPSEVKRSSADILLGLEPLNSAIRETSFPHLSLVPSNADMIMASQVLQSLSRYEHKFRDSLALPDAAQFDMVIFDCPPSLGPVTITALTAADLVIIPTQCEYFSMQALHSTFELVRAVRSKTNPALKYRVLVTMFDLRGRLHTQALAYIQQHFASAMLQTIIGFDSKLRESQVAARPITAYAQHSRGALQYRQLAEELSVYAQGPVLQTA